MDNENLNCPVDQNPKTATEIDQQDRFGNNKMAKISRKNFNQSLAKYFFNDLTKDYFRTSNLKWKKSNKCSSEELVKILKANLQNDEFDLSTTLNKNLKKNSKSLKNRSTNKQLKCKENNKKTQISSTITNDQSKSFKVGDIVWGSYSNEELWPGKILIEKLHQQNQMVVVNWLASEVNEMVKIDDLKSFEEGFFAFNKSGKKDQSKPVNPSLKQAIKKAKIENGNQWNHGNE